MLGEEVFERLHLYEHESHITPQVGHDEIRESLEAVLQELTAEERLEEHGHDAENGAGADEAEADDGADDCRDWRRPRR